MENKLDVPLLNSAVLTERVTLCAEKKMKDDLVVLKERYGVDVPAWIRKIIGSHLPDLKKQVGFKDAG